MIRSYSLSTISSVAQVQRNPKMRRQDFLGFEYGINNGLQICYGQFCIGYHDVHWCYAVYL